MAKLVGLPVANHPSFLETWNQYSKDYNVLTEKMMAAGIDITYLINVVDGVE